MVFLEPMIKYTFLAILVSTFLYICGFTFYIPTNNIFAKLMETHKILPFNKVAFVYYYKLTDYPASQEIQYPIKNHLRLLNESLWTLRNNGDWKGKIYLVFNGENIPIIQPICNRYVVICIQGPRNLNIEPNGNYRLKAYKSQVFSIIKDNDLEFVVVRDVDIITLKPVYNFIKRINDHWSKFEHNTSAMLVPATTNIKGEVYHCGFLVLHRIYSTKILQCWLNRFRFKSHPDRDTGMFGDCYRELKEEIHIENITNDVCVGSICPSDTTFIHTTNFNVQKKGLKRGCLNRETGQPRNGMCKTFLERINLWAYSTSNKTICHDNLCI